MRTLKFVFYFIVHFIECKSISFSLLSPSLLLREFLIHLPGRRATNESSLLLSRLKSDLEYVNRKGESKVHSGRAIVVFDDACKSPESAETLSGRNDNTIKQLERRLQRLVFRKNRSLSFNFRGLESKASETIRKGQYLKSLEMYIAELPNGVSAEDAAKTAEGLRCVQYVLSDYTREFNQTKEQFYPLQKVPESSTSPNDPYFGVQWHLHTVQPWSTKTQTVWQDWKGAANMIVAITDSGCDIAHQDLKRKIWVNPDEICGDQIDNDDNGYVDDCVGWDFADNDPLPLPDGNGHGTAAAGIVAAATDNGRGVAGMCWECQIMCLRFIKGSNGKVSDQISAINYAVNKRARVSNNSYGGYGMSVAEYIAIQRAMNHGHLFAASAGNNNKDTDLPSNLHTPSVYPLNNILAVGASNHSGKKPVFSNFGNTTVDILAPGMDIVSIDNGDNYAVVTGTSFAAPMGAAAAALIWSRYPDMNYTQVIDALSTTCNKGPDNADELKAYSRCGGVLDVAAAMQKARQLAIAANLTTEVPNTNVTPAPLPEYILSLLSANPSYANTKLTSVPS